MVAESEITSPTSEYEDVTMQKQYAEEEKKEEEPLAMEDEPVADSDTHMIEPVAPAPEEKVENNVAEIAEEQPRKKRGGLKAYLASLASRNKAKKEYLAKLKETNKAKKKLLSKKGVTPTNIEMASEKASPTTANDKTSATATTDGAIADADTDTTTPVAAPPIPEPSPENEEKSISALAEEDEKPKKEAPIVETVSESSVNMADSVYSKEAEAVTPSAHSEAPSELQDVDMDEKVEEENEEEEPKTRSTKPADEVEQARIEIRDVAEQNTSKPAVSEEELMKVEQAAQAHAVWTCCAW